MKRREGAASLPGLCEPVAERPLVLVDGAHTPRSGRATREAVAACWPDVQPVVLLTAMLEEKSHAAVAQALADDVTHVVVTQVASPRCIAADTLASEIEGAVGVPVEAVADQAAALERARTIAGPEGLVLVAGSVYLAGDVKLRLARTT